MNLKSMQIGQGKQVVVLLLAKLFKRMWFLSVVTALSFQVIIIFKPIRLCYCHLLDDKKAIRQKRYKLLTKVSRSYRSFSV